MLFLSALISGLLQLVSHLATRLYFPHLGLVPRYVIGTLCMLVPATGFYGWKVAEPFWFAAVASGIAVWGAMWLGDFTNAQRDLHDERERGQLAESDCRKLLDGISHAKTEEES